MARHEDVERLRLRRPLPALRQAFNSEDLTITRRQREHSSLLKAFTVDAFDSPVNTPGKDVWQLPTNSLDWTTIRVVLSTSLMVTGNTIGAGALVLPEVASRPGIGISVGLFVGKGFQVQHKSFHNRPSQQIVFPYWPRGLYYQSNIRSAYCRSGH